MNKISICNNGLRLSVIAGLALSSGLLQAQEDALSDDDSFFALEEVVVTARKRQETIQNTPIAITAMDQSKLEEANVRSIDELSQFVPGLQLSKGNTGGAQVFIRGIGQRDNRVTLEPGAAVYVDGVYIARQEGSLLNTLEVRNIQVLRGPQGTLFGKNTISGAVLVETVRPMEEFEGFVEARVGNYGRRDVRFGANIPLIENTLLSRFSYSSQEMDGFMKNVYLDTDASDENKNAAIGQLSWLVNEELVVDFRGFWSEQEEKGHGLKCIYDETGSQQSGFPEPAGFSKADPSVIDNYRNSCRRVQNELDDYEFLSDREGLSHLDTGSASLTVNWEMGELGFISDAEIKAITSWLKQTARYGRDFDATEWPYFATQPSDPYQSRQVAQEIQLTGSALDEDFQFTSGIYFFNDQSYGGIENNPLGPFLTSIPSFVIFDGNQTMLISSTPTLKETDTDSLALYFQGTYDITPYVALTGGIRYTKEKKEVSGIFNVLPVCAVGGENKCPLVDMLGSIEVGGSNGVPPDPTPVEDDDVFDSFTPMANLTLRATEDMAEAFNIDSGLIYITYSQGFKAGGFNFNQGGLSLPEGERADRLLVPIKQEEVDNYEIGLKLDALDNRLRFNSALYYMDYRNIQVTTTEATEEGNTMVFIKNAGEASISGFEMELTWMPIANLLVDFNASIINADLKEFNDSIGDPASYNLDGRGRVADRIAVDRKDEEFTQTPDYTAAVAVSYDFEYDWVTITPRLDVYHQGDTYFHFDRGSWLSTEAADTYRQKAFTLVNARLSFLLSDEHTSFALWGKNLTDEFYYTGGTALVDTIGGGNGIVGGPRMYGVDARYRF